MGPGIGNMTPSVSPYSSLTRQQPSEEEKGHLAELSFQKRKEEHFNHTGMEHGFRCKGTLGKR